MDQSSGPHTPNSPSPDGNVGLATGNENDDELSVSSSGSVLDGYITSGGEGERAAVTGKAQERKVLRLARLMEGTGGKLPISMGGRPSGIIKPFMGNASSNNRRPPPPPAPRRNNTGSESKEDSKDDEKHHDYMPPSSSPRSPRRKPPPRPNRNRGATGGKMPGGNSSGAYHSTNVPGMKVLDTDSTQAKLDVPSGLQGKRKKRTRKRLDV